MRMCTCVLANLPFFAPVVGAGIVVGIDVVGIEAVDGGAHIIIHCSVCFRIKIQVREVYEHTWKFYY